MGYRKKWFSEYKAIISLKRGKIRSGLLLRINRRSHTRFRSVLKSTTLDNLGPWTTTLFQNTCATLLLFICSSTFRQWIAAAELHVLGRCYNDHDLSEYIVCAFVSTDFPCCTAGLMSEGTACFIRWGNSVTGQYQAQRISNDTSKINLGTVRVVVLLAPTWHTSQKLIRILEY